MVNHTDIEAPYPGYKPKLDLHCKLPLRSDWLIEIFLQDQQRGSCMIDQ